MRQIVVLLSLVLIAVFVSYNYYQLRAIGKQVNAIYAATEQQKMHSNHRFLAQQFYIRLVEKSVEPRLAFERFNHSAFFDEEQNLSEENGVYAKWEQWQSLLQVQQSLIEQKKAFDRIVFDESDYDASLVAVADWIQDTNKIMDTLQALTAELIKYLTKEMKEDLATILTIEIVLIASFLSLWYWQGYNKQKRHLSDLIKLNKDLESKKRSLLASQKVMASIFEDMKQEKTRAVELANDNQQLAFIVQQANDVIFRLTLDGKILSFNNAIDSHFNIDRSKLYGADFSSLFVDSGLKAISNAIKETLDTGLVSIIHLQPNESYALADGLTYEASFSVLHDSDNKMIGLAVIVRDISYQYQEIEQLRTIIYQAPNALIMTNQDGQIIMSNAQAEALFGYENGGLLGESIEQLVPEGAKQTHAKLRKQYMKSPAAKMGAGRDLTARRKDGSEFQAEIGLSPIVTKGKIYIMAAIVDISERLKNQESLNAFNQQLAAKNREMEQFIYTVSHDLRSPLVTIEAFAKKLAEELKGSITEKQLHRLTRIQANVGHMEQLLMDLLNLSRIIQKKIEKDEVDTEESVNKVLNTLEEEILQAGAHISIEKPLLPVIANESMLHQCLQNLLGNAIKYRDLDRPLQVRIYTQALDSGVAVAVADNGLGIDAKYHEQIFRIFERLEQGEGTGVGLSIVKTIMEKHNGEVLIESEPGKGSTFTLVFPK